MRFYSQLIFFSYCFYLVDLSEENADVYQTRDCTNRLENLFAIARQSTLTCWLRLMWGYGEKSKLAIYARVL